MTDLPAHLQSKAARLLARIHRKYETRAQVVRFGDVSFTFTRIKDPEAVLDEVAEEETRRTKIAKDGTITFKGEPLRMPYWAELWESAEAISMWLMEQGRVQGSGFRVQGASTGTVSTVASTTLPTALDLGCGMGLAGCTAAAVGYAVTFADIEAPSLMFAELNALPFPNVTCRKTNWQTDDLGQRFDLIIGADILYERTQWEFLEPFWRKHLAEDGVVLLGEPGRPTSEPFADWVKSFGWKVKVETRKVTGREQPIRLLTLTRG